MDDTFANTLRPTSQRRRWLTAVVFACVVLSQSSCVTVYQPLVSLQRPVAIDTRVANFDGLRIRVRCVSGEFVKAAEASQLCTKVQTVLASQGALVDIDSSAASYAAQVPQVRNAPDLVVELNARLIEKKNTPLLWLLCGLSLTLIPSIDEYTFAQDVSVRDANGAPLLFETFQARFVGYFGLGVWALNGVLDLVARSDSEKIGGDVYRKEFSSDFFGHLSELVHHARMRQKVLREFQSSAKGVAP